MPFPCFWRRSSSYNVKHDYDGIVIPPRSVSFTRSLVADDDLQDISARNITVLKTHLEDDDKVVEEIAEKPFGKPRLKLPPVDDEETTFEVSHNHEATLKKEQDKIIEKNNVKLTPVTIVVDPVKKDVEIEQSAKFESPVKDEEVSPNHNATIQEEQENNKETNNVEMTHVTVSAENEDEIEETVKFGLPLNNEETTFDSPEHETTINEEEELKIVENTPVTILIEPAENEDKIEETEKFETDIQTNKIEESTETLTVIDYSASVSRSSSLETIENAERFSVDSTLSDTKSSDEKGEELRRRSGVLPTPVRFDEEVAKNLVKYPKTESDEKFIKDAITRNEFLSKVITGRRLQDVVDAMYHKEIRAREKIIKEGQRGVHMYVAYEGEFEVTKKGKGVVNIMKPGDVFGELAILYNAKRFATVKSITPSKVWVIDGTVYQQLVKKSNIEEQEEIVSFLQKVPILNEAGLEVLQKVAGLLKPEFFETGTTIVKEGDKGDKFYIITAGSVTITQENNGFMGQLHRGNCFGEKALLKPDLPRQATIKADDPGTECLTLTQQHFVDTFGKIEDISKITMPSQPVIPIPEVKKIPNKYSHLDLREFKILKTLGVGGFGRVEFIQHKKDPSLTFALKCLKKYEMVQQEQQYHVINEMSIQMTCNSPFIIRLYNTFKDNKFIYFLMEVCLGGDLWSLLQRQPNKNFTEKGAKFIAGCVLEALAYLHKSDFVYRDLKPENLLIDNNGYIKMTDFGFAKRLTAGSKSGTFAGTPEYLAPEIILNRGHDKAVDLWAYGIFVYELLNGRTPFRSNDPSYMKTYNNILNGLDMVSFPQHNSAKAKSLISKLLKKTPCERLGIEDIRTHKWFSEFDWEKLRACKMASPYRPKLATNVDFKYIDHFRRDNDIPPDESSWWDDYF